MANHKWLQLSWLFSLLLLLTQFLHKWNLLFLQKKNTKKWITKGLEKIRKCRSIRELLQHNLHYFLSKHLLPCWRRWSAIKCSELVIVFIYFIFYASFRIWHCCDWACFVPAVTVALSVLHVCALCLNTAQNILSAVASSSSD